MKNLCKLFAMAMVLLCVAVSCEKDGVYNPKQKIDRVYCSYEGKYLIDGEYEAIPKHVQQVWNWNGNQLNSISFYDEDGELDHTENYTYDSKNRLSEITWGGNGKYKLVYDGDRLSNIEYFYESTLDERMELVYDGKNISEINVTYYYDDLFKGEKAPLSPAIFRIILPDLDAQSADRLLAQIKAKDANKSIETYSILFEWDGKNIKKVTLDYGEIKYYQEFSYDNMKNPFKGLFNLNNFGYTDICSANNIVRVTLAYDYIEEYEYNYTYEGKFPATKTISYSDSEYSYSSTYYYEYR